MTEDIRKAARKKIRKKTWQEIRDIHVFLCMIGCVITSILGLIGLYFKNFDLIEIIFYPAMYCWGVFWLWFGDRYIKACQRGDC